VLIPQARHEILQESDELRQRFWAVFRRLPRRRCHRRLVPAPLRVDAGFWSIVRVIADVETQPSHFAVCPVAEAPISASIPLSALQVCAKKIRNLSGNAIMDRYPVYVWRVSARFGHCGRRTRSDKDEVTAGTVIKRGDFGKLRASDKILPSA